MPHIVADRVKETSTTTGTGNLTLAGAVSTFQAFSAVCANNDTFFYVIVHQSANEYEVGLGTFVSATPAIARTTILESSNADAAVSFSAGTKDIFITSPAIGQSWGTLRVTPSANQNDYNPTGLKYCNILEVNGSITLKLTGLQAGSEGQHIEIRNVATDFLLWLENENTASAAANRFTLFDGLPAFLMPGHSLWVRYNGTADRWEITAWPARGMAMGLGIFSDQLAEGGIFTATVSGTGASGQISTYLEGTTERTLGLLQLDTGTTATGRASLGAQATGLIPTLGAALGVARLAVEATVTATETFQIIAGFQDAGGGTFTDGVAWNNRWNGAAAEWSQDRLANAVATRSVTGSPTPDNNYICLAVFVNVAWTRADFLYSTDGISWTKADSPTTGLPGNTRFTNFGVSIIKSAGTTQRNVTIDFLGFRVGYVRA